MNRPKGKLSKKKRAQLKRRRLVIAASIAIVLVLTGIIFATSTAQDDGSQGPPGKIRIAGFNAIDQYETPCQALMPTCGYCPGEVIAEECYLTQAEFDEYKRLFSLLEAAAE